MEGSRFMLYLINEAMNCLLDSGVTQLPINARKLRSRRVKWRCFTYRDGYQIIKHLKLEEFCVNKPAFSMRREKGDYFIFYNEYLPFSHVNYIIAHEIGHILLGHCLPDGKTTARISLYDEREREADGFASHLLAPACVLSKARVFTPGGTEAETAVPAWLIKNKPAKQAAKREISYSEMRLCLRFILFIAKKRMFGRFFGKICR
jgi:Zn-dependent peptidase ImmA (M78 family)